MRILVKIALAVSLALAAAPALAEPVAVVVNRENPNSKLTVEELRSIYLGRRSEWPGGIAAVAIDQAPGVPSRAVFLDAVVGMSKAQFAEHWVDQRVRGSSGAPKVAA